jgi:hypothetical protein
MNVPDTLAALIRPAAPDQPMDQAFPLLTVDAAGYPHVALLASTQLGVDDPLTLLLASVAGTTTRANLSRDRRATLLAVDGIALHIAKLDVVFIAETDDRAGFALRVVAYRLDSAGTALHPMMFARSDELVAAERWDKDTEVLARLRQELSGPSSSSSAGNDAGTP